VALTALIYCPPLKGGGQRPRQPIRDTQPAVVLAGSAADVAHAVRFARAHRLRIAPQGTGHGALPLEPLEGTMLLKTSRLQRVQIDPSAHTARAEAGALWQDVTVPASQHGLAALAGTSPNVGVTGASGGAELIRPLRALDPELDTFATIPAPALQQLHMDPEQPVPRRGRRRAPRRPLPWRAGRLGGAGRPGRRHAPAQHRGPTPGRRARAPSPPAAEP
jgi:FAD binding domain